MSVQVEKLEKNMVRLTIELNAEQSEDVMKKAFDKSKSKSNTPGFRKGKAPRVMIEETYDGDIFCEDAANETIDATCMKAMNEGGLEIVFKPEVAVDQIGKDKPFICTATVVVRPEVTLGEYKSIGVEKVDAAVESEDAEAEFKEVQEQNARLLTIEDRPVADGDQIVIDFEGFVDGKTFDGGKAADHPLTIGSHSFIDTLEEQLIGKNIGEECEISITFPEEYHAVELAGKSVTSKVTIKEIKVRELPELDDEFAGEVSESGTLDEYKKDIKAKTLERKQKKTAPENENRTVDKVVAGAFMEIPDRMVEDQIDNMVQDTACRTAVPYTRLRAHETPFR